MTKHKKQTQTTRKDRTLPGTQRVDQDGPVLHISIEHPIVCQFVIEITCTLSSQVQKRQEVQIIENIKNEDAVLHSFAFSRSQK